MQNGANGDLLVMKIFLNDFMWIICRHLERNIPRSAHKIRDNHSVPTSIRANIRKRKIVFTWQADLHPVIQNAVLVYRDSFSGFYIIFHWLMAFANDLISNSRYWFLLEVSVGDVFVFLKNFCNLDITNSWSFWAW